MLAAFGATISYRPGKRQVRADMLSRIKHDTDNDVAIIDTDEPFDTDTLPDDNDVTDILPLIHDGLNLQTVANDQQKGTVAAG